MLIVTVASSSHWVKSQQPHWQDSLVLNDKTNKNTENHSWRAGERKVDQRTPGDLESLERHLRITHSVLWWQAKLCPSQAKVWTEMLDMSWFQMSQWSLESTRFHFHSLQSIIGTLFWMPVTWRWLHWSPWGEEWDSWAGSWRCDQERKSHLLNGHSAGETREISLFNPPVAKGKMKQCHPLMSDSITPSL